MKNLLLIFLLFSFASGCTYDSLAPGEDSSGLIFQSEYTNNAWGYNHNGWMLDKSGEVKSFQKSASWVFPDAQGYISEADMQKNLASLDAVIARVSTSDFAKYGIMALTCAGGPLSKAENKMADAGALIYCFYLYEADQKRYRRVVLDMTGDWSQQNLSPNAKGIVDFLKNIK